MVASWISPNARKGISSGIAGRGLFATEQIGYGYFSWYLQRKITEMHARGDRA
ncbi:MAG: hypothetical protein QOG79_1984 [Mycobacterium sp.]|jgi:hypothetical protein|nr:hypothetical protein [Mycobacterium sp.]